MKSKISKKIKQVLSFTLAFALVFTMFACLLGVSADSAFDSGLLRYGNGDFELGDPLIGLWYGSQARTDEDAYKGDWSLKATPDANGNLCITMDCFEAGVGFDLTKTYVLSAWVKIFNAGDRLNGNPYTIWTQYNNSGQIPFYTDDGNLLVNGNTDGWVHVTANLSGATDEGWCATIWATNASFYIDNLSVKESVDFDSGVLRSGNGDFEKGTPTCGTWYGSSERTAEDAYAGNYSYKLTPDSNGNATMWMDNFEAGTGEGFDLTKTYALSAWVKIVDAGDPLNGNPYTLWAQYNNSGQIPFYTDDGNVLANGNTDGWVHVTANLSGATDEGWCATIWATNATFYVDNLSIKEIAVFDSGLLKWGNGDFEKGTPAAGAWYGTPERTVEDAYAGNYSYKLSPVNSSATMWMDTDVELEPEKAYMLSAWVKVVDAGERLNGNPYTLWVQYNNSGQIPLYTDAGSVLPNGNTDGWVHIRAILNSATEMGHCIQIWATNATFYVDNLSIIQYDSFDSGLLRYGNGDFEFGDPLIGCWSGSRERTDEDSYMGDWSLKATPDSAGNLCITMDCFEAGVGFDLTKTYVLSAWVKIVDAGNPLNGNPYTLWAQYNYTSGQIPFYTDDGNVLANSNTDGWVHVTAALKGATDEGWLVTIWGSNAGFYIDNISVKEYDAFDKGLLAYCSGDFEFGAPQVGVWFGSAGRTMEDAYAGNYSLKVTPADNGSGTITVDISEEMDSSKTYLLSAWVKVVNAGDNGGNVSTLWMQNDYSGQRKLVDGNTDGWVYVQNTFSGTAAQGHLFIIWAYNATFYIDNLKVEAIDTEDTGLFANGSFESNGYTGYNPPIDDNYSFDTSVSHSGKRSLKVTGNGTYIETTGFVDGADVEPEKTYEVGVWAKASAAVEGNAIHFKGHFYGENTDVWQGNFGYAPLTTEWTYYSYTISGFECDAAATSLKYDVKFGITDSVNGVDVWFDDFTLKEVEHTYENVQASISTTNVGNIYYSTEPFSYIPYKFKLVNNENYDIAATTVTLAIYDSRLGMQIAEETFTVDALESKQSYTKNLKLLSSKLNTAFEIVATVSNEDFTKVYTLGISRIEKKLDKLNDYLGVLTHIAQHDGSADKIDQIADVGFGWINDDIRWDVTEIAKGEYSISQNIKDYVDYADKKGMKIRINLSGLNSLYDNGELPTSEEGIAAFAAFCGYVAETFEGKIDAYEIFSEFPYSYVQQGYSAQEYIDILAPAYEAIKEADPTAKVGAIGLLRDWDTGFFHNFLQWGGTDYCDAIDLHPYAYANDPKSNDIEGYVQNVVDIMAEYEISKPLWIGEIGWSSSTELPSDVYGCTETQQAAAIMKSYFILKQFPQIEMVQLYDLSNDGPSLSNFESNFGLYRWNMESAKLALNTVTTINEHLEDVEYVEDVILGDNLVGMRFTNSNNENLLAVWSSNENNYKLRLNANGNTDAQIMDLAGNRTNAVISDSKIIVEVSSNPVVIFSDSVINTSTSVGAAETKLVPVTTVITNNSITVKAVDGYEYSINGTDWQSSNVFVGLTAGTEYTVYQRIANSSTYTTLVVYTDWICGDINNDGSVNATDLTSFRKYFLDVYTCDMNVADVNEDGVVDIRDLVRLKKNIANLA